MDNLEHPLTKQFEVTNKISAMICTRNRGETALMAVRTLLANTHPDFECVVIDQSTDTITQTALRPFYRDPRFHYLRSDSKGKGKSLNFGMQQTIGDIVAITDDDCEVPVDWLEKIESVFAQDANIGVVFCQVNGAEHDPQKGFIPSFDIDAERTTIMPPGGAIRGGACGIGAGMAVRRSCIEAIGGFDDNLGPGALFPSADESDVVMRALLKGFAVFSTNRTHVLHYGFRTWDEGKLLTIRDTLASGAASSKHFRSGIRGTRSMVIKTTFSLLASAIRDSFHAKRPLGAKRVIFYLMGFIKGMRVPIDREALCFQIPDA